MKKLYFLFKENDEVCFMSRSEVDHQEFLEEYEEYYREEGIAAHSETIVIEIDDEIYKLIEKGNKIIFDIENESFKNEFVLFDVIELIATKIFLKKKE